MAITAVVEIARVEVSDEYGVTLWQKGTAFEYSVADARALAQELWSAASEAERALEEDGRVTLEQMRERLAAKDKRAGVI